MLVVVRDEQPADIGADQPAERHGAGDRQQRERRQRVGREERHPVIAVIGEAHLVVGEELVMLERVPVVDRAPDRVALRTMHHVAMQPPLEEIAEQEHDRDGEQLEPRHLVQVREVDVQCGQPDRVDDRDVQHAVVPACDPLAVIRPIGPLPLAHVGDCEFHGHLLHFLISLGYH